MKTAQLPAQRRLFCSKTAICDRSFKENATDKKRIHLSGDTYGVCGGRFVFAQLKRKNPEETARGYRRPDTDSRRKSLFDVFIAKLRSSQWLIPYAGARINGILDFCRQEGILSELKATIRLAEMCFWSSEINLEKDVDPETGDTQIVITLSIRNKPREAVLIAYRNYRKQFIKTVPWPERGLIRLSYALL
jgi:hypothetical protein